VSRRVEQKQAARGIRDQLVKERRRKRLWWISLAVVVLLAGAGVATWRVYRAEQPAQFALPANVTNDGGSNGGILVADEGGAIPVDIYQDFLCATCKAFQANTTATMNQLLADKKIRVIWHPVSLLDSQSNPPGYSMRAASAMGCAANVGMNKMKALGEALYQAQPAVGSAGLSDDQIIDIAGRVGIITPVFAACERDVRYRAWVNNVNAQAIQRGISETPTVFVNNKLVPLADPATLGAAVASGG
jgi:protein-disulfide isomerase